LVHTTTSTSLWPGAPRQINCYAPQFDNDIGDHLRIELGLDSTFLPVEGAPSAAARAKSNVQSVLRLAKELGQTLPVARRRIWTETGEDFAERFREAVS
jgi:hypothetical protein